MQKRLERQLRRKYSIFIGICLVICASCVTTKQKDANYTLYYDCLKADAKIQPLTQTSFEKCGKFLPERKCEGQPCGGLTQMEIQGVIRVRLEEVRACYEAELLDRKDAKGKIVVIFSVNPNGQTENVSLKENDLSTTTGDCVAARIREWLFPQPRGNKSVQVTYPFGFSPHTEKATPDL